MTRLNNIIVADELYQALRNRCYAHVPFVMERKAIEAAVQAFFKFLDQPEAIKAHIDFSISPKHRRGDVGFRRRDPKDHIYNDSKDFFHYHPAILKRCASFLEEQPTVGDFIRKAQPIWELAYQVVNEIMQIFEKDFPGVSDKIFDAENVHILLRFLKYDWQNSSKYLAKPHFDAGSFTLAIAESCPGLRIGSCPENLQIVQHKPDNAVFMLASNYQKIMNPTDLAPGWHDVIQMDETLIGKPFARWAVVAFIEAHDVEALPRTETHKWYTAALDDAGT